MPEVKPVNRTPPLNTGGNVGDEKKNSGGISGGGGGVGNLTSPEGVLMLSAAGLFDLIGLIPIINIISNIIAGIIIGGWMLLTGKKALKNFFIAFIVELIPIASDIGPFVSLFSGCKLPASWVGCVYKTLKAA